MSYAILWSEDGGPVYAGRLELEARRLRLVGTTPEGDSVRTEIALSQLATGRIARARSERLDGRPALLLGCVGAPTFRLACLEGSGALLEIADRIGFARRVRGTTRTTGGSDGPPSVARARGPSALDRA